MMAQVNWRTTCEIRGTHGKLTGSVRVFAG
jgi:hypothetical protein